MTDGAVQYSYLGISGGDVNLYYIEELNLPNNARGVIVSGVENGGGPAAEAGIQNASNPTTADGVEVFRDVDIITGINGTPITGMGSLVSYLAAYTKPGDTVQLDIVRNGTEELTLAVTLDVRPTNNP